MAKKKRPTPLPKIGQQVWVEFGFRRYPYIVIEPGCVEKGDQIGVHLRPLRGSKNKWEVLENVWKTD